MSDQKKPAAPKKAVAAKTAAKSITADAVVKDVGSLKLDVSRSLDQITEQVVAKVFELSQISEAIEISQKELEELRGKEAVAMSLDEFTQKIETQKKQLQWDIEAKQSEWTREQQKADQFRKEQEAQIKKNRERDEADYAYTTSVARRKAEDEHLEKLRLASKAHTETQEQRDKDHAQREAVLKSAEQELEQLRIEVKGHPEKLRIEAAREAAIKENAVKREHDIKVQLLQKDIEGERKLFAEQLAAKDRSIAALTEQVTDLKNQLLAANKSAQDVTIAALHSASGRQALESVKDIQAQASQVKK